VTAAAALLPDPPIVLDGGMSNALEELGHDLSDHLWSARLLRDGADAIAAVHRAYYRAGALVATTASYQASVSGFVDAGADRAFAQRLLRSSVSIARDVRDELADDGRARLVAASVGPYGAVLADGSEYRGRYGLSASALRDFHGPRLELLASAGPDLLAVETIPDVDEAVVLVELVDELALPAWFSYSVGGDRTRAGQPLQEAFAAVADATSLLAVGVNCCAPGDVLPALQVARGTTDRPLVAYPNSGEIWDGETRGWTGRAAYDVALAADWVKAGAGYVGGCCRVGPADIAALTRVLTPAGS
jgi:homocysteine S-methyltransferase